MKKNLLFIAKLLTCIAAIFSAQSAYRAITSNAAPLESAIVVSDSTTLRFEVTVATGLLDKAQRGRLFVVVSHRAGGEPRFAIGQTGMDQPPVFAHDVNDFAPGKAAIIDNTAAAFPIDNLAKLPAGDYMVQ